MELQSTTRQHALLQTLADHVNTSPNIGALVVLGSFANRTADAVSDLDLFFIAYDGHFQDAWERRRELHVTGAIVEWDELAPDSGPVAGHRWLTPDVVLVESVISVPEGGGRLAEPFKVVAGDAELVVNFPRRPAVQRAEMTSAEDHPVDVAYDALKKAVRNAPRS